MRPWSAIGIPMTGAPTTHDSMKMFYGLKTLMYYSRASFCINRNIHESSGPDFSIDLINFFYCPLVDENQAVLACNVTCIYAVCLVLVGSFHGRYPLFLDVVGEISNS